MTLELRGEGRNSRRGRRMRRGKGRVGLEGRWRRGRSFMLETAVGVRI